MNALAPSFRFALAASLGATGGIAYALSPFTVWFFGAMVALFWWAGRGLSVRERRWIWGVLGVAVALRVLVIATLFITSDGRPLATFDWDPDGGLYKARSMTIVRIWQEMPPALWSFSGALDHTFGWSSYVQVLAYLQFLMGRASYGIHLLNTAFSLTTAVLLHRVVRPSFGPLPALLGLAVLVFWPSWFASSVSSLRDPLFGFFLAVATACCVSMVGSRAWTWRAIFGVFALGACAALDSIREGGTIVAVAGLLLGVASTAIARRATAALLVAPLLVVATVFLWDGSFVGARAMSVAKIAARRQIGAVFSGGETYKLLDDRFYRAGSDIVTTTMTPVEAVRFAARSVASVVLFPFPWQSRSTQQVLFIPQQVVWYLLVCLAVVGVGGGLRRDVLLTSVLTSMTLVHLAVVASGSGNFGTMVRHRDTAFQFVVWLGALGTASLLAALRTGRTDTQRNEP